MNYTEIYIMIIKGGNMKIVLVEANNDLGVIVDGSNLGPHKLTKHFKNLDTEIVNKPQVIKEKNFDNKKKNLDAVNFFDKNLYNTCLDIKNRGNFPIVIGGDHTVAISSSLASIKKEENIGIIWIDAHADYNTFETTVTGNLHGLPLAAVNGNCPMLTQFFDGNFFNHQNTVIVGARDIDKWEIPNLIKDKITFFTTDDIKKYGVNEIMDKAFEIASNGTKGIHISYDIDVIDPIVAPGVSVPAKNGINYDEAMEIVDYLIKNKDLVKSMDLVEFNPTKDIDDKTEKIALEILEKVIKNNS